MDIHSLREPNMLVLSRKPGEKLAVEGGIVLTIVHVDGQQVRLGFEAPEPAAVRRTELPAPADIDDGFNSGRPLVAEACLGI